jgi:hypothetical protein
MSSETQKVYIRAHGEKQYLGVISIPRKMHNYNEYKLEMDETKEIIREDNTVYLDQVIAHILSSFLIYIKTNNKPIEWFTALQNNLQNYIFECEDIELQKNLETLPRLHKSREFKFKKNAKQMATKTRSFRLLPNHAKIKNLHIWQNNLELMSER